VLHKTSPYIPTTQNRLETSWKNFPLFSSCVFKYKDFYGWNAMQHVYIWVTSSKSTKWSKNSFLCCVKNEPRWCGSISGWQHLHRFWRVITLGSFFITEKGKIWLFFRKKTFVLILTKMGWAIFCLQNHPDQSCRIFHQYQERNR
jgi:hypothetical protein